MKDFIERLTSYKSTLMAAVTGILTILVAVKIVSGDALADGIVATGNLFDSVVVLLGAGLAVYQLFTKDKPEAK